MTLLICVAAACGTETTPPPPVMTNPQTLEVRGTIDADTTWTTGNTYVLKEHIFVLGGTLTIQPGVTVKGGAGSSLVITQNARINAVGTLEAPIVFTSAENVGARAPGDWGGVVLLGKAKINVMAGTQKIEGFPDTETRTVYGGNDDAHDCGKVKFVRIEFAGFQLAPDNELNGLTMGGCGSATEIDYVQTHKGADDGVEIFGGTVNVKHLVITQPDDDGLDWDYGWTGRAQFVVVQQNALVGNCGIEADNSKAAPDALPRSNPDLWNVSLIGSDQAVGMAGKKQIAILLRRGTAGRIHNTLVTHFTDFAVDVDGAPSVMQANGGDLYLKNSVLFDNAGTNDTWPMETDNDEMFDEAAFFTRGDLSNRFMDPQIERPLDLGSPSFVPKSGSPMMTGGATPPAGFFDTSATFVGAIGATDWTAGWTAYPAN